MPPNIYKIGWVSTAASHDCCRFWVDNEENSTKWNCGS